MFASKFDLVVDILTVVMRYRKRPIDPSIVSLTSPQVMELICSKVATFTLLLIKGLQSYKYDRTVKKHSRILSLYFNRERVPRDFTSPYKFSEGDNALAPYPRESFLTRKKVWLLSNSLLFISGESSYALVYYYWASIINRSIVS